MAKTAYQIKKALGITNGLRAKNRLETTEELKADIKAGKYKSSFGLIKSELEKTINFDTFESDLSSINKTIVDAYNGWQTPETLQNTRSSIESMQNRLRAYKEYNQLFGNKDASKGVSKLVESYRNVLGNWDSLSDSYSQYKNAESYTNETTMLKKLGTMNSSDVKVEMDNLAKLESKLKTAKEYEQNVKNLTGNDINMRNSSAAKTFSESVKKAISERDSYLESIGYKNVKDLEKDLSNKKIAYTTVGGENITWQSLYDTKKQTEDADALYKEISSRDDFEKYRDEGASIENPSYAEADNGPNLMGWRPFAEDVQNKVEFAMDNKAMIGADDMFSPGNKSVGDAVYTTMTNQERDLYNYHLGQERAGLAEKGTADKYLNSIYGILKDRYENKVISGLADYSDEHPVWASGISVGQNLASIVEYGKDSINYLKTGELDTNSLAMASSTIRSTVSNKVDWEIGNWDAFDFLYNTGMSMIDSYVGAKLGGAIGGAGKLGSRIGGTVLGVSAAAQGTNDALERGLDNRGAFWNGFVQGVFEGLFESYSIGKFNTFKEAPVDGVKSIIKNVGKSMVPNAQEEFATELANLTYDYFVNGDLSQAKTDMRAYMSAGMSENEAIKKAAWGQGSRLLEAAASGGLMGIGFGGIAGISAYSTSKRKGQNIKSNERASEVFDIASNPEMASAYDAYTQYVNKGIDSDNIKDAQLGSLYTSIKSEAMETLKSKKATSEQKTSAGKTLAQLSIVETENTVKKELEKLNVGEETKVTESGVSVDIKNLKVKGDEVTVATEKGDVSVDDMTLAQKDAELVSYARIISRTEGDDVANLFVSQYDGETNIGEYANAFELVSTLSKKNSFKIDDILNSKGVLSADQAKVIYKETRIAKVKADRLADEKIRNEAFEKAKKMFGRQGVIDDSVFAYEGEAQEGQVAWKDLSYRQRKAVTFANGVFSVLADNVVWTKGTKYSNGFYRVEDNTLYIDVDASKSIFDDARINGKDTLINTISHELTHQMEVYSPETFREVSELVLDALEKFSKITDKSITRADIIAKEIKRLDEAHPEKNHTEKDAISELVARACEDMLAKSEEGIKMFNSLSETEQKKLTDMIRDIIKKLKDWINDLLKSYQSNSDEAKALRSMQDTFDEVLKKWDKMLLDIAEQNKVIKESGKVESKSIADSTILEQAKELQRKDPRKLTESDFKNLLEFAKDKVYADGSYIPSRIGTPQILIAFAKEMGYVLENHPLAMNVYKVRQAMSNEAEWDGNFRDKPHNLSPGEVIEIVKAMSDPSYLVFQTNNERFAEIVKLKKEDGKTKAYAIIDFYDVDKNSEVMNGYEGGKYNILVTIYPSENNSELRKYLNNKNNIVVTGEKMKKKGISQRGLGSFVPAHLNDTPFYTDSISNPDEKVKGKSANKDSDIRFSMKETVEETKDLIAVHNLSPEKLLKTLKLGGLPMPSIAITRAREGYNNFGNISLVFNKETIDPQFMRSNKVYSGDAWTPTYPQVEYKLNTKAQERIKKKIDALVPSNVQSDLGGTHLDSTNMEYELNRHGDIVTSYRYNYAMKYAFLKDNNVDIELPTKEEPFYRYGEVSNSAVISFAYKMVDGLKSVNSLLEQHSSKLMADTDLLNAIASALNEEIMSTVEENTEEYQKLIDNPVFKPEDIDLDTVLGMLEAARKYYHSNGKIDSKIDYREARTLIDDNTDMPKYEAWLKSLFSDVIAKEGIRNNKDLFTPSGNRRSFEALHYEHTLENVIKAMKEEGAKGIGGFGGGNLFGASTREYGSIDEIKADATNRMKLLGESKYDEIKKGFSDRLYELANSLPIHKDSFSALDDAANMLIEAVLKFKTKSGMANYLRTESKGWANYSDYIVDDLVELVNDIRSMPVAYFEAKPQRAVGFDEIKAVIMPSQESYEDDLSEVKSELEKINVPILEYEYGDNNDRLKALNSLEEVRFSDKDAEGNTLTEAQQEFFKDSKVRDENGNLLVMYHGTDAKFNVFQKGRKNGWLGKGIYFAEDEKYARENGKNVLKVYLNVSNPFIAKRNAASNTISEAREIFPQIDDFNIAEVLKENGYDGIISNDWDKGIIVSVFDPEQIKLTTNTKPTESEDIRYSDKDESVYDIMGETERITKENERLKEDVERLKERLEIERKVTHGNFFNQNHLGAVAGHLRNISKSNMDKVELMKALKEVYSYIAHSENLTWEEVLSKCSVIAKNMLSSATPETIVDNYSKEILRDIRSKKISFSDVQKKEAQYIFGKNWNRNFFGRATVTDSGISLEHQWQEWADLYPHLFDRNISDADMPTELYNIIGSLQDASETIVEYDEAERVRWLAQEIYNQYWNVSPIRTTADKYDKQIKRLNFEHRKAMSEFRNEYKERIEGQKLADDIYYGRKMSEQKESFNSKLEERNAQIQRHRELYQKLRERKDNEIAIAKQHGKDMMSEYKERAERKTRIQSITANALTLNKWLTKNSKDYYIHDAMKGPVIKLLQALDFSSKTKLETGLITQKDVSLAEAFSEVKTMLQNATDMVAGFEEFYGHDLAESIDLLSKAAFNLIGDNSYVINAMSNTELYHLDRLIKHIKKTVTDINKLHIIEHNKGAVNLANEFMVYGEKIGSLEKQHGRLGKYFTFRNRTPYYFFKDLGEAGIKIFRAFQDGWDKLAYNSKRIIDFAKETYTEKEVKEWSNTTKEFTIMQHDGTERTINMSIAQIMALHCVSKQEDAQYHLLNGGMTLKRIDKKGHVVTDYDNITLSVSDIQTILSTLTDRQIEVADALQKFMNDDCTKWGNEISMARFGSKMFGIPNYFPIKVSEANTPTDNTKNIDNASLFRLLNMSFTKARKEDAPQSIEIGDIFDIFAQHSSDMAKYNALALPVLDFNKIYSIQGRDLNNKEYGFVKTLKSVFGDEANEYIRRFVRDLNGSQNVSRDVIGNTFFKNAKVASVAANLRVILLQPTAFYKASAVMDNKYLIKAGVYIKVEPIRMVKRLKKAIADAEKHCGIIQWKSLGYYDTDISKGITEKIKHADTWKDKVIEKSLKGAEIADKVTFGTLWVACEFEIRDTRKDLKVGSDEFYKAIGERLRDVVYATQVVDSTMTRSDMMRSPDGRDKMYSTFASEPTVAYNMLLDLVTQYNHDKKVLTKELGEEKGKKEAKKRNSKKIRKVVTAYVITHAVAALVESGFDILRDDDDEEKDVAEYMKLYLKNFLLDMSIGNKLPYIKELYSIMQGYSSSRMDTQWMMYAYYAASNFKKILEGEGDWEKAIKNLIKAASDLTGLPGYNVFRDAMAILDKLDLFD